MNPDQYGNFLTGITCICVFGALFNIPKYSSRGIRAYMMSAAFLSLGCGALLIRNHANPVFLSIAGGVTFALLAGEALMRINRQGPRGHN